MATEQIKKLGTNFKDDILSSSNSNRKYRQTSNSDGTLSFTDVTSYQQNGTKFGSKEVIEEREVINKLVDQENNRIKNGNPISKVFSVHCVLDNSTSYRVCSKSELDQKFGLSNATGNYNVFFTNIDGGSTAGSVHVEGATWQNGYLFAVFDRSATGVLDLAATVTYFESMDSIN